MHPQIRRDGPGFCPICGMALEPLDPGAAQDRTEYRDMLRRFWISLGLSAPVFALAMIGETGALDAVAAPVLRAWIEGVLAAPVVVWAAAPFFARGWKGAVSGHANMFTLIGLGVGVAFVYSLVALLFPAAIPMAFHGMGNAPPVYFEAAAVIVTLVLLGQVLELRARATTGAAVRALLDLAPKTVRRRVAGGVEEIPLAEVRIGDELLVRPSDSVPTDGTVIEGESAIDESMITGESLPVSKSIGDAVTGGTLNGDGALVVRAERVGADTMLAKIVALVGRSAAQPRADPGARRHRRRLVRARGRRGGGARLRGLARARSRAVVQLRAGRGRQRPDHRLPLRARPRHADVGDGRGRQGGAGGRAGAQRDLARATRRRRRAGDRQDRHGDGRKAHPRRSPRRGRRGAGRCAGARRGAGEQERPSARPRHRLRREGEGVGAARDFRFRQRDRPGPARDARRRGGC